MSAESFVDVVDVSLLDEPVCRRNKLLRRPVLGRLLLLLVLPDVPDAGAQSIPVDESQVATNAMATNSKIVEFFICRRCLIVFISTDLVFLFDSNNTNIERYKFARWNETNN